MGFLPGGFEPPLSCSYLGPKPSVVPIQLWQNVIKTRVGFEPTWEISFQRFCRPPNSTDSWHLVIFSLPSKGVEPLSNGYEPLVLTVILTRHNL